MQTFVGTTPDLSSWLPKASSAKELQDVENEGSLIHPVPQIIKCKGKFDAVFFGWCVQDLTRCLCFFWKPKETHWTVSVGPKPMPQPSCKCTWPLPHSKYLKTRVGSHLYYGVRHQVPNLAAICLIPYCTSIGIPIAHRCVIQSVSSRPRPIKFRMWDMGDLTHSQKYFATKCNKQILSWWGRFCWLADLNPFNWTYPP